MDRICQRPEFNQFIAAGTARFYAFTAELSARTGDGQILAYLLYNLLNLLNLGLGGGLLNLLALLGR